jgi:hypothetical protein
LRCLRFAWSCLKYSAPRLAVFLPPFRPSATAAGSFFRGIFGLRQRQPLRQMDIAQNTAYLAQASRHLSRRLSDGNTQQNPGAVDRCELCGRISCRLLCKIPSSTACSASDSKRSHECPMFFFTWPREKNEFAVTPIQPLPQEAVIRAEVRLRTNRNFFLSPRSKVLGLPTAPGAIRIIQNQMLPVAITAGIRQEHK